MTQIFKPHQTLLSLKGAISLTTEAAFGIMISVHINHLCDVFL